MIVNRAGMLSSLLERGISWIAEMVEVTQRVYCFRVIQSYIDGRRLSVLGYKYQCLQYPQPRRRTVGTTRAMCTSMVVRNG